MIYGASAYGQLEYGGNGGIPILQIAVFESTNTTDNLLIIEPIVFISLYEATSITEYFSIQSLEYGIDFEVTTITEYVSVVIPLLYISINDTTSVSDSPQVTAQISIFSAENTTISEFVVNSFLCNVIVSDSTTSSDIVNIIIPVLYISVHETITVLELISNIIPTLLIFETDIISLSDYIKIYSFCSLNVVDSIIVSDLFSGETMIRSPNFPLPIGNFMVYDLSGSIGSI